MPFLELSLASGESSLSVRRFAISEAVSSLFDVLVVACSPSPALDLAAIVGRPASLRIGTGVRFTERSTRTWSGLCSHVEQVHAVEPGLGAAQVSTYALRIVPALWMLTQRRGYRVFQHLSIPDIVDRLLAEWGLEAEWRIDRPLYPKLEYRVQYGESDHDFMSRLLEEAGIAFAFLDEEDASSRLVFGDRLHLGAPRAGGPIPFADSPNEAAEQEFVTGVRLAHEVRPGAYTLRDHDMRSPAFALFGEAPRAAAPPTPEHRYEQYHYLPGAALIETGKGSGTPVADDEGFARHVKAAADGRAERALAGERQGKRAVTFGTNVVDLWPGVVFSMGGHPHPEIGDDTRLLVVEQSLEGTSQGEWVISGRAVLAAEPYRPALRTPRPVARGVQSAIVVGPPEQEIHTDEFGRVRVQFPWDREGTYDDRSSCWIRVSQGWGGAGYGMFALPRVGQEVLVAFVGGDPDQPVVLGRAYNAVEPVPYRLPENRTQSGWKSESSPGGGGFNEILFEDRKGEELFSAQAERDQRQLIKRDETITVGRHRRKHVALDETDTTGANRTEVTGVNRTEVNGAFRTTLIGANRLRWVRGRSTARTEMNWLRLVGGDAHLVVKRTRRERDEADVHLLVKGDRRERIGKSQSLTVVGDQQEKVGGRHALAAGKDVHLRSGDLAVGEAGKDLTVKGPGGFIRIDSGGITLEGTVVKINAGGNPGKGRGSRPEDPEPPEIARVDAPELPDIPDLPEPPRRAAGEERRAVLAPRWSKAAVAVGAKVHATFLVSGFSGGEPATIKISECGPGWERRLVDTVSATVDRPRGRIRVPWSRGGDQAEADLREERGEAEDAPLEYRFEVEAGGVRAEGESGPLWLTKTIVVDLVESEESEEGKREREAPDGLRVTVTGADGAQHTALTQGGKATVDGVVVGRRIAVQVDAPGDDEAGKA